MSLKAPSGGGQRPIPPAGAHPATCYSIIDIGTQTKTFKGKDSKLIPSLIIIWEFPNLPKEVFDEAKGPQPLVISQEYTVSVSDKSNIYRDLQNWRGVPPTDLEKELPLFLGQSCLINVIHSQSADKTKVYANVSGIMRLPQGIPLNPPTNPKVFFNLDNYSHVEFMKVPEWIRKKIMASQEWPTIVAKFGSPDQPAQNTQQGFHQPQGFGQTNQPAFNQPTQNNNPIVTGNDAPPF